MHVTAIIPARLQSNRLPEKVIADIHGKPLIQWVYEAVKNCDDINDIIVATDDNRIKDTVHSFGGKAVMTSVNHNSGTDRIAEVAIDLDTDIIINVQGDEPLIKSETLSEIIELFKNSKREIVTAYTPFTTDENLFDFNTVKVVLDEKKRCLYFSRHAIPAQRDIPFREWINHALYFQHMGIYAFRKETLIALSRLESSTLEKAESLEQLRWLQAGYTIHGVQSNELSIGVDTEEDLERVRKELASKK